MSSRKKVVWNKSQETGRPEQKGPRPRPYVPDAILPEETTVKLTPHLQKGTLWRTAMAWFSDVAEPVGYELPPHPYAQGTEWQTYSKVAYKQGTFAVYLGTTRVEESKHGGQMISIPRHTFMIDGNVFLVRRLTDLEPVV